MSHVCQNARISSGRPSETRMYESIGGKGRPIKILFLRRGYCLEMICADFLAGAHLDNGNPEFLLNSISRYYGFLPGEQQQAFLENLREKAS
jgi:hypothetical protein